MCIATCLLHLGKFGGGGGGGGGGGYVGGLRRYNSTEKTLVQKNLSFVECVWQPVPDNGHDTAERLWRLILVLVVCVLTESRDTLHRGAERTKWVVSVGNRCMLVLCPWGTGFCWYCIFGEHVSVGIVSVGNMFLLVLYPWRTGFCWYCVHWFVVLLCPVFLSHCTWQG